MSVVHEWVTPDPVTLLAGLQSTSSPNDPVTTTCTFDLYDDSTGGGSRPQWPYLLVVWELRKAGVPVDSGTVKDIPNDAVHPVRLSLTSPYPVSPGEALSWHLEVQGSFTPGNGDLILAQDIVTPEHVMPYGERTYVEDMGSQPRNVVAEPVTQGVDAVYVHYAHATDIADPLGTLVGEWSSQPPATWSTGGPNVLVIRVRFYRTEEGQAVDDGLLGIGLSWTDQ